MRFAVVIEHGESGYGAYVPDLPGCVAVGETHQEIVALIHDAIEQHIELLVEAGYPVPQPASWYEAD